MNTTETGLRVTIAVLTFRRPDDLARCLPLLLDQVHEVQSAYADRGIRVEVLVVDNDPDGSAASVVTRSRSAEVIYELETRPGVSAARNKALDCSSKSDLLAFIDDDERPEPGWLSNLIATWFSYNCAAVAGKVVPQFDGELDPWIEAGRFFVRRTLPTGTPVAAAGAGNLLLDLRVIRRIGLRFNEKFGLSGGEDTLFTRQLTAAGYQIIWCQEAVAIDRVPKPRMTRRWVLERSWSHGNTAGNVDIALTDPRRSKFAARARVAERSAMRIVGGALRFLWGLLVDSKRHQARGLRASFRGMGMLSACFGFVFKEYRRPASLRSRFSRHSSGLMRRKSPPDRVADGASQLTILLSFPPSRPRGNPYRILLEDSLRQLPEMRILNFTWRTALTEHYDAFHVHWPEILVSGEGWKRAARQALFLMLLLRLRFTRTPIIRTVHNLELPAGISILQTALLKLGERQTSLRIRLNEATPVPSGAAFETILHGDYQSWYGSFLLPEPVPGRIAFFGLVRRYKSVDLLIEAFRSTLDAAPALSLVVAGNPSTAELAESLQAAAAEDPRITLRLEFIPEDELVAVIGEAQLIVLPYKDMHNSAGVLTALSLGRPVLVPDNPTNRDLAREVGAGWVHVYSGNLTGDAILQAVCSVTGHPASLEVDFKRRDWRVGAQAHLKAYQRAVAIAQRRR